MKNIVMSVGGSVLVPREIDTEYLTRLSEFIKDLAETYQFYIVVGGGMIARTYISAARKIGETEYQLDKIGIFATRLNALMLKSYLKDLACPWIPTTVDEAAEAGKQYKVVIMGGTEPGHTTDTVAMLLAEKLSTKKLINITSIDAIYDSDPASNKKAKRFSVVDYKTMISLIAEKEIKAGPNVVLDLLSVKIAERSKIEVCVLNGSNFENIKKAIEDKLFEGTRVIEKKISDTKPDL